MIAMPGMVDTHRHTWQTALRGVLADGNIPDYLRGIRLQMAPRYRAQDMYVGNYLGALDALNSGVTSIVDYCHNILDPECAHAAVTGLKDAGIRGLYGHGLTPVTENTWSESKGGATGSADPARFSTREKLAREIRDQYFSDTSLLRFGIAPQELTITPVDEVAMEFRFARELGARITTHANQVMVRQLFKDVEVFAANGLLGDDLLAGALHVQYPARNGNCCATRESWCPSARRPRCRWEWAFQQSRRSRSSRPGPSLGIDCVSGCGGDMISHSRLVLQASRWRADEPGYQRMVAPQTDGVDNARRARRG